LALFGTWSERFAAPQRLFLAVGNRIDGTLMLCYNRTDGPSMRFGTRRAAS
jgi:hypothetical protein